MSYPSCNNSSAGSFHGDKKEYFKTTLMKFNTNYPHDLSKTDYGYGDRFLGYLNKIANSG